jgi:hypothetical protein
MFGSYPTHHQILELEEWGVDIIVNLTNIDEKNIRPYITNARVIEFPIPDHKVPDNVLAFCGLVIHLSKQINDGKKIYIHCKAGHGRSGVLVSSLLCYILQISPQQSFKLTTEYHSTRPVHARRPKMNEFWKNKGSPQTQSQKDFVMTIFQPYNVPKHSPFNQAGMWIKGDEQVDTLLKNTYIGPITGNNGCEIQAYRDSLIEDLYFKVF